MELLLDLNKIILKESWIESYDKKNVSQLISTVITTMIDFFFCTDLKLF